MHKHSPHDKITNVLRGRVQDLTMWESDLLVRVCSGCCCNQRGPHGMAVPQEVICFKRCDFLSLWKNLEAGGGGG